MKLVKIIEKQYNVHVDALKSLTRTARLVIFWTRDRVLLNALAADRP